MTLIELLEREAAHRTVGDCADHVIAIALRMAAARLRRRLAETTGSDTGILGAERRALEFINDQPAVSFTVE